jgi:hypothetical protein
MDQTVAAILNGVGVVGVVLLVGWLIWTGRLVTRREIDDIAHDRDEWRAAHRISETARVEEREHNAALIEDVAKPIQEFLLAFRQTAIARRESDQ